MNALARRWRRQGRDGPENHSTMPPSPPVSLARDFKQAPSGAVSHGHHTPVGSRTTTPVMLPDSGGPPVRAAWPQGARGRPSSLPMCGWPLCRMAQDHHLDRPPDKAGNSARTGLTAL